MIVNRFIIINWLADKQWLGKKGMTGFNSYPYTNTWVGGQLAGSLISNR